MDKNVVIIGAGQAGLTAAVALRERGWKGEIHLLGEETHDPYQRPPLSKGYLAGKEGREDLRLRSRDALEQDGITLWCNTFVEAVDRGAGQVQLRDGRRIGFDTLIFATGSRPRSLRLPGHDLMGIHTVRTIEDADALHRDLELGGDTVFIGGGLLNLEVAIEARKIGNVTVLEMAPQILGRVLSRNTADALASYHAEEGVEIRCGSHITSILGEDRCVAGVELAGGEIIPAARVVVSIGAEACDELAKQAGLATDGGILVDNLLRTQDHRIFAIGDCAKYPNPFADAEMRVESVQNATDQARFIAAVLTGQSSDSYCAVPWFWSTQGERRLQIAGIAKPDDGARVVSQGDNGQLVVERVRNGTVVAVETINAPGPHMKARRSLAATGLIQTP
ncbi:NAD(P)/FAD-dependent oxidoreductase [Arthrobacter sp. NPDC090010]|uniref:NAD(P)/FAD-dependent oxidoreductase n=1 Tax=Arthrobacter sp. NPDC090010 TaxID=3363942 RepID=UPI00381374A2